MGTKWEDVTKDNVFAVEMRARTDSDEELGLVGVRSTVGHDQ